MNAKLRNLKMSSNNTDFGSAANSFACSTCFCGLRYFFFLTRRSLIDVGALLYDVSSEWYISFSSY